MSSRNGFRAAIATVLLLAAACSVPQVGAVAAPASASPGSSSTTAAAGSVSSGPLAGSPQHLSFPTSPLGSPASASTAISGGPPDAAVPAASGSWAATVESGLPSGIPSPTGGLTATLLGDRVCLVPVAGAPRCELLVTGATATFAVFAPDGGTLLVIADSPGGAAAYLIDTGGAATRVLGPGGVQDFAFGSAPPAWDLSSAVWGFDGSSVLLVPRTAAATGPVLEFDLTSGTVATLFELHAELANSTPSMWTTATGLALLASTGDQRNILWWADFASGGVTELANYPLPGGSLVLTGADPMGHAVLICPRRPDGALGATNAVVVQQAPADGMQAVKLLPDSMSCAGSVFSADGQYLAVTAEVDGAYRVLVIDRTSGARVLTVPLPVATPSSPPYLTWLDDVIVAADVTGEWPAPSLVVRLTR